MCVGDTTEASPALWDVWAEDREVFAAELEQFVPDRVFDAHAHLWEKGEDWGDPRTFAMGPERAGLAQFRAQMAEILPGRSLGGIFMGSTRAETRESYNAFIRDEIANDPNAYGHLVVPTGLDTEELRATVKSHGFRGLKVYHTYAASKPTWNAEIPEFLPEEYVRVCHEESWSITLHIVRDRALADARNQQWIQWASKKYPNAKLILAHAGRGFNGYHTVQGIDAIRGLDNVWFDAAAVAESLALEAIMDTLGPERLLWGSDYPVANIRGRVVTIGDTFVWLDASAIDFKTFNTHAAITPYLLVFESLRALKSAARSARLSDKQVEGIFWDNAQAMLAR